MISGAAKVRICVDTMQPGEESNKQLIALNS
jgi:hypothetical protein